MSYNPDPKWFLNKVNSVALSNTTNLQKMFDITTNGAMILPRGTFLVDWFFAVENMSATSGNALVSLLGAGTAGSIASTILSAVGIDGAADTTANQTGKYVLTSTATTGNLFTATTNTTMMARIKAVLSVGTAGTIIPSIGLTTAIGTATVRSGSYCLVEQVLLYGGTTLGDVS
jgi:hypothetical protein